MIPDYLVGKSAAHIIGEQNIKFFAKTTSETRQEDIYSYAIYLEGLLLIAVKDALCNADDRIQETVLRGVEAEGRAIAFLCMVLPYKEKNNVT
jgi:hypothetical protein